MEFVYKQTLILPQVHEKSSRVREAEPFLQALLGRLRDGRGARVLHARFPAGIRKSAPPTRMTAIAIPVSIVALTMRNAPSSIHRCVVAVSDTEV